MKIYATTDTHLGHQMLVDHGHRPAGFEDLILRNIAKLQGDLLIHCGDICIGNDAKHIADFMAAAKGFKRKYLVRGNHDHQSYGWYLSHGFDFVGEVMLAKMFGRQVVFSHMPMPRDDKFWQCYYPPVRNIHGHYHGSHGSIYDEKFYYDLAPETNGFAPVNIEKILV